MNNQDKATIDCMNDHGGSFVRALAAAALKADPANLLSLKRAFSTIWLKYEKMGADETPVEHAARRWIDCGEGVMKLPDGRDVLTRVVEAEGWGRIMEVYDYSDDPEGNFRLLLAAPQLLEALKWVVGNFERTSPRDSQDLVCINRANKLIAELGGKA